MFIHSVSEPYSCDLTKSRVGLLGGNGGYLGANASLLGRGLVSGLVTKSIEASLKYGSLRLGNLVLTALFNELVKGWHDFPPSLFNDL